MRKRNMRGMSIGQSEMYQLLLAASHPQVTSRVKTGAQRYRELSHRLHPCIKSKQMPERLPHAERLGGAMGSLARDVAAVEPPAAARF